MAKKTAHSRSTTQRNRSKTQKSIELVRQTSTENDVKSKSGLEEESNGVAITTATASAAELEEKETKPVATTTSTSQTSASARLAARRQATQQQRSTVTLITAEHYRYVRNDLIYIAILAAIMFSILIV